MRHPIPGTCARVVKQHIGPPTTSDSARKQGKTNELARILMPRPRTLTELKADPEIADDIKTYMVALVEFPARAHAAE
jgi:hypothetical protein